MATSSLSCHSNKSALMCHRDQLSVCISQGMATGWNAALDCCVGWKTVLHFGTVTTHLYTSTEMGDVGVGTVQEQLP